MKRFPLIAATTFFVLIAGCGHVPVPVKDEVKNTVIDERVSLATRLLDEKKYYRALMQWRVLRIMDPDNRQWQEQVTQLEDIIDRQIAIHTKLGKKALKRGKKTLATTEFLKALALDPRRQEPRRLLRDLDESTTMAVQIAKLKLLRQRLVRKEKKKEATVAQQQEKKTQDYYYLELGIDHFKKGDMEDSLIELKKYLATNPADDKARRYVRDANLRLAERREKTGDMENALAYFEEAASNNNTLDPKLAAHIKDMRIRLAEQYYEQGLKVFRHDIDKAIELWERAVHFDPQHVNARLRLKSAYQLRKNLKGIVESDS